MTRALRRFFVRVMIGVMLFAQLVVAAYACPGITASVGQADQMSAATAPADRTMSGDDSAGKTAAPAGDRAVGCDQMPGQLDKGSPNLCAQHCHYGQQSDQAQTPTTPAAVLTSLYIVTPMLEVSPPIRPSAASASALAAASPPLAILHCRFRD